MRDLAPLHEAPDDRAAAALVARLKSLAATACVILSWSCAADDPGDSSMSDTELPPFRVVDDASYQRLVDAGVGAEILRFELSLENRPRITAASALLMAFAERNPNASEVQLIAYVSAVDTTLREAYSFDPDLVRAAHLLPALRFVSSTASSLDLVGHDIRVGGDALALLELGLNTSVRALRVVDFERTQSIKFANYTPFARLVTLLLLDQKPSGTGQRGLAAAMLALADANGLDLRSTNLEERYPEIARARASLPMDFAAFEAERSGSFAGMRSIIDGTFDDVRERIDASLVDIAETLVRKPDPFDAAANVTDAVLIESLRSRELAALRERGESRATLLLSTLLIEQSEAEVDRHFARQSQDFSDAQLQTDDTLVGLLAGLEIGGLSFRAAGAFATGNPLGGVGALLLASRAVMSAVGPDVPSADEQIFAQILALREQVEALRMEMHERFDSIDRQLSLIYEAMAAGLNQINQTTRRIDGNVQQISIDLYELRSSLTSLEANLYGVLSAGFEQSFIEDMETGLDFRRRTGASLDFVGPGENTFFAFHSRFHARATSIASDEVYAGPQASTLFNDHTALGTLLSFPLGYNINNLRQFPRELGLPVLEFGRAANPTTWALAADAYAQLARENPWYFAKLHENEPGRLDTLIRTGEAVRATLRSARSRPLIEALVAQHARRAEALQQHIGLTQYRQSAGLPENFDPFAGLEQNMRGAGAPFTKVYESSSALSDSADVFFDPSLPWELVDSRLGLAAAAGLDGWAISRWHLSYQNTPTNAGIDLPQHRINIGLRDLDGTWFGSVNLWYDFVGEAPRDPKTWMIENGDVVGSLFRSVEGEQTSAGGFTVVFRRYDDVTLGQIPLPSEEDVLAAMGAIADDYWVDTAAELSTSTAQELVQSLSGTQALLAAYVAMGLPETMDENDLVHAILRGTPTEPGHLSGEWVIDEFEAARLAKDGPPSFVDRLAARAELLMGALAPALDAEHDESHPYLEWSLASLHDLSTHALNAGVADTYRTSRNATLSIGPVDGVLANDAPKPLKSSVTAVAEAGPENGEVALSGDGSFTYTPREGYVGRDTFSYVATMILDLASPENTVTSAVVPVVIWVQ